MQRGYFNRCIFRMSNYSKSEYMQMFKSRIFELYRIVALPYIYLYSLDDPIYFIKDNVKIKVYYLKKPARGLLFYRRILKRSPILQNPFGGFLIYRSPIRRSSNLWKPLRKSFFHRRPLYTSFNWVFYSMGDPYSEFLYHRNNLRKIFNSIQVLQLGLLFYRRPLQQYSIP